MSQTEIYELTPGQEALIPFYREKWRSVALSTERIERQKASELVKAAYAANQIQEPEVLEFDSPDAGFNTFILSKFKNRMKSNSVSYLPSEQLVSELPLKLGKTIGLGRGLEISSIYNKVDSRIVCYLLTELRRKLEVQEGDRLVRQLFWQFESDQWVQVLTPLFTTQTLRGLNEDLYIDSLHSLSLYYPDDITFLDFSLSVLLNNTHEKKKWEFYQSLVQECGWTFPFANICIICDRPIKLSFDNEQRFHAEGEPAIQFADGYSLYCHHGVTLPEKYGKLHPSQWRSQWLLEEDNAELRRVLIQIIGYSRICQELQAIELDSWQEYTLLKIDNVDIEPIYLLKMTCPSTGFIHALRVPPGIHSTTARRAIIWVNWGTDPEEFAVQT